MSYIVFDNGMRVECKEKVRAVDNIIVMPRATITLGGNTYHAHDVRIDLNDNKMTVPALNGDRTTWEIPNA